MNRRPRKGGKDRIAVVKAFAFFSLPFVFAETATGVVSLLSGELRIPPTIGTGTAVDVTILILGLAVAVFMSVRSKR